jgi:hypothetical protein
MKMKILKTISLSLALILFSSFCFTACNDNSSSDSGENSTQGEKDYAIEPSFEIGLKASHGDFDTDGDGENDFTGIALDVYVKNISRELKHGICGVDAEIHFDNKRLEPLYKTKDELNGISGVQDPKPVYNFPRYSDIIDSVGVEISLFSIDGLCNSYAHTDGSFTNPDNEGQQFTGAESYISCNYIIDMATHVAWTESKMGLTNEDYVQFRYYFKVLDNSTEPYVFTVPDSPDETVAAKSKLCAPYFADGDVPFSTVTGKGAEIKFTIN